MIDVLKRLYEKVKFHKKEMVEISELIEKSFQCEVCNEFNLDGFNLEVCLGCDKALCDDCANFCDEDCEIFCQQCMDEIVEAENDSKAN